MKLASLLFASLFLVNIALAEPADDKAALAPFINEATLLIERYDLSRIDIAATHQWLLQAAHNDKTNPRQAQYIRYLEKGSDVPRLMELMNQLKAAGATRVYVVATAAILADPPGFLFVPVQGNVDAGKVTKALEAFAPEPNNSPRDEIVQQLNNAVVLAPRVALPGLKSLRPIDRPDLLGALQSAGDAPIIGGVALNPSVSMIFEQTMPNIPFINRPTSDITRNFRSASIAATPGDNPSVTLTVRATNAQGAQVLNSVVSDAAKFAASPGQHGQTPKIPQPEVNNDTLKLDLTGDNLAGATFGMIDARLKSQMIDSITRIRVIIQICHTHMYNVEKGDKRWPADLDVLVKSGELKADELENPRFPEQKPGFIYVRAPDNLGEGKAMTTVVLYE